MLSRPPRPRPSLAAVLRTAPPAAAPVERLPPQALFVLGAISQYVGAALAVLLFAYVPAAGVAWLRIVAAAAVLVAWRRPWRTSWTRARLRLVAAFGVALGLMNWSTYEAIDRIPLGVAVTIEFAGPLLVAVIGSRRPLDGVWIALAATGIVLLVGPGSGSVDAAGVGFALAAAAYWMAAVGQPPAPR